MLGLQAKCGESELSYTQLSKMEGMLGKIKMTFQRNVISIRLRKEISQKLKEPCCTHSLKVLKACIIQQKNYN